MKRPSLHQTNNILSIIVLILGLYVLLAPFLPQFEFWWDKSVVKDVPPLVQAEENRTPPAPPPDINTLVIPKLNMQQQIHENKNPVWGLGKGVWRHPTTSSPDRGGNTVLSGHRFTYGGPAVFYHMDKLATGDDIVVYWNKQRHVYKVSQVRVMPPGGREILAPTEDETLTIYTCTPLVTARNRLVIIAKKFENHE